MVDEVKTEGTEKGVVCPKCGEGGTKVVQTHGRVFVGIIRLRKCPKCGCTFYTQERIIRRA